MDISNELLEKIIRFALKKHSGQKRKGNGLPYFFHPFQVALTILKYKKSKNIRLLLAVCFLHDVVEDCGVTLEKIAKKFGHTIASLVEELTTDKELCEAMGKATYLSNKVVNMSSYSLCIKLSDRLNNVNDMDEMSIEFKKRYKKETKTILQHLEEFRKLTKTQKAMVEDIKLLIK